MSDIFCFRCECFAQSLEYLLRPLSDEYICLQIRPHFRRRLHLRNTSIKIKRKWAILLSTNNSLNTFVNLFPKNLGLFLSKFDHRIFKMIKSYEFLWILWILQIIIEIVNYYLSLSILHARLILNISISNYFSGDNNVGNVNKLYFFIWKK